VRRADFGTINAATKKLWLLEYHPGCYHVEIKAKEWDEQKQVGSQSAAK